AVCDHECLMFVHRSTVLLDVVIVDRAIDVEGDPGNFLAATFTWSDSRKKQQIANALGVWKRAHRFGRARAFEGFAHALLSTGEGMARMADRKSTRLNSSHQ